MLERIHLEIVREVARQGSLTAAAQKLCLTQSALSHAVKKLEGQLGTSVWRREGHRLHPTPTGDYLLAVANRVLPQLSQAERHLGQLARGERGSLRIGIECHPCYRWIQQRVAPFLQQFPDVEVDVKQQFQFGGIGALFQFEIDMLVTPDPLRKSGLLFEAVFGYEQVLVVAANHPLAAKTQVMPADLADEVLMTYPVDTERLDIFTEFLAPAGMAPRQHKTVENTEMLLQMVACGRGVTALPQWFVAEYAEALGLVARRLGPEGVHKHIHLGIRRADRDVVYLAAFMALARQTPS